MKLCLTGWSFRLLTVEETAGIALALGFDAVDFGAFPGGQLDRAAILGDQGPEIRRLRASGVTTSNIYWTFGAGFGERAVNNPDPQVRSRNWEDWQRIVGFPKAVLRVPGSMAMVNFILGLPAS